MGGDRRRHVRDVHLGAVVGVGSDQQGAVLGVEREVGDVDVAGGTERSTRLPVQAPVMVEEDSDPLELRHQFLGPATINQHTRRISKGSQRAQLIKNIMKDTIVVIRCRG